MILDDFFLQLKSIAWVMVRELCDSTENPYEEDDYDNYYYYY